MSSPASPDASAEVPPVVERVLSLQMQAIPDWTTGHAAWFWREKLGQDWTQLEEHPPVPNRLEVFDDRRFVPVPPEVQFGASPNRLWLVHKNDDRVVQVQNSRFLYNWRDRKHDYPKYETLADEFEDLFERYCEFLAEIGLAPPRLNQWEVTYVDHIPIGSRWESAEDWGAISTALANPLAGGSLDLESANLGWSFLLPAQSGRLHLAAKHGVLKREQDQQVVILEFTARGPIPTNSNYRECFDSGHAHTDEAFRSFIKSELLKAWGQT